MFSEYVSGLCSVFCFFFQAEDGIRDLVRSRGLGDVYKRQGVDHRIRVQRDAVDALIHQPFGQVGVVGGALTADADVLAGLVGGRNGHRQQHFDLSLIHI